MKAVAESDNGITPGGIAGDLDGVLDRFGPRVCEHGLLVVVTRSYAVQSLRELHISLVHRDMEALVQELLDLIFDCRDYTGMAAADIQNTKSPREVDELVPVDIGDLRPVALGYEYRNRVENGAGNCGVTAFTKVS